MSQPIQRIAICTGGGDAPGLNAVIQSTVVAAHKLGWSCYGIHDGFNGILFPERYVQGGVQLLSPHQVRGIGHLGGTMLGTTNKGNPLHFPVTLADGSVGEIDRTDEILAYFAAHEIHALIAVGGDGSLTIANALHRKGLRVVGVPKTIDNDLDKTFSTFGFDSAVGFATECIDRLHSTAQSHQRVMVVEVMGRYAGWIALHAGIAGNAHVILLPEIGFDLAHVARHIRQRESEGSLYSIVVAAEGARPLGGDFIAWPALKPVDLSDSAASASKWPRSLPNAPARKPARWCLGICCAAAARPHLTGWRRCVLARRRYGPCRPAIAASWSRSACTGWTMWRCKRWPAACAGFRSTATPCRPGATWESALATAERRSSS